MQIPVAIRSKLEELHSIVDKYPENVPVAVAASFFGITVDSLRAMIESRRCPFGLGWLKPNAANRAFCIPTITFYLWVTNPAGEFKEGNQQ